MKPNLEKNDDLGDDLGEVVSTLAYEAYKPTRVSAEINSNQVFSETIRNTSQRGWQCVVQNDALVEKGNILKFTRREGKGDFRVSDVVLHYKIRLKLP